jgi:hypothetical protein
MKRAKQTLKPSVVHLRAIYKLRVMRKKSPPTPYVPLACLVLPILDELPTHSQDHRGPA